MTSKFIIGGVIIVTCIVGLVTVTAGMSLDFYSSVSDFKAMAENRGSKIVRVRGLVQAGSVTHDAESLNTSFIIADDTASLQVRYHGVLPSTFTPGSDIVVQGKYDPQQHVLAANQLMFKCPSKYESAKDSD